jgi:ubiquinone/menaquinone biosynthesis C-methylase UbiE/ribosomal protein L37AE/L43A
VVDKKRPICDYEGSDYQERFWERSDRLYEDRVEAAALKKLLPPAGERILEVGAGAGRNVTRYHNFQQVTLVDYARSQLELAQQRLGREDRYCFVIADAYHLPFAEGVFDCVTMIRTLHHMVDPISALQQVRDVSHSGAVFILEFANKRNLKAILRWIARRQDWNPFHRGPVEFATLNFDFHPGDIRCWLEESEFQVERQLTVSHFRVGWLKRWVPLEVLVGLDTALQGTGRWWQYTPSIFVRSVAIGESKSVRTKAFWRCPECRSLAMEEVEEGIICRGCGKIWTYRDGIYNFREPLKG